MITTMAGFKERKKERSDIKRVTLVLIALLNAISSSTRFYKC